jgi:hypothetical protein
LPQGFKFFLERGHEARRDSFRGLTSAASVRRRVSVRLTAFSPVR